MNFENKYFIQDNYLKQLNLATGCDELEKFTEEREKKQVSEEQWEALQKIAQKYQEEFSKFSHFNSQWCFQVINNYFFKN